MKRYLLITASMLLLSSCGDTSLIDSIAEQQTVDPETAVITEDKANYGTGSDVIPDSITTEVSSAGNDIYSKDEIDLTEYDSNMVYAIVYDMMFNGDQYLGKVIKARGIFGYYKDEETGEEYFGVIISDAAACCSQGIEFVLDGEYKYPDDYPEPGTDITVTGIFNYYTDDLGIYIQLLNADLIINTNGKEDQ